jgi:hypothetical protein
MILIESAADFSSVFVRTDLLLESRPIISSERFLSSNNFVLSGVFLDSTLFRSAQFVWSPLVNRSFQFVATEVDQFSDLFNTSEFQAKSCPHEDTAPIASSPQLNLSNAFISSFFSISLTFFVSKTPLVSIMFIHSSPSIRTVSFSASSEIALSDLIGDSSLFALTNTFMSFVGLDNRHASNDSTRTSLFTLIGVLLGTILLVVVSLLIFMFWRSDKNTKSVDDGENREIEVNDEEAGAFDELWDEKLCRSFLRQSVENPAADDLLPDAFSLHFSNHSEETFLPDFFHASD